MHWHCSIHLDSFTQVVRAGDSESARPSPGSVVEMRIEGMLESGTVVDRHTITFIVGDSDVIKGMYIRITSLYPAVTPPMKAGITV